MNTVLLRSLPGAVHVVELLESLIIGLDIVPSQAERIGSHDRLPKALREIVVAAEKSGKSWRAWGDRRSHVWLFVGEQDWALSRDRKAPVLALQYFREHGFRESGKWMLEVDSQWQRCIDLPGECWE